MAHLEDYSFDPTADLPPEPVGAGAPLPISSPPAAGPGAAMHGPLDLIAPPSTELNARRGAGWSVLLSGSATVAGACWGGWYGAGAGLLLMGSLRNIQRSGLLFQRAGETSAPADRGEAVKSMTMALIGGAAGAYLGYHAYRHRKGSHD